VLSSDTQTNCGGGVGVQLLDQPTFASLSRGRYSTFPYSRPRHDTRVDELSRASAGATPPPSRGAHLFLRRPPEPL